MRRLQVKDQEWRSARREWNKIWHEVHEKNFYRSLDCQSLSFKHEDKKKLNSKVLVSDIKKMYQENLKSGSSQEQLLFQLNDVSLFNVCNDLIGHASHRLLNRNDRKKLSIIFEDFLPALFLMQRAQCRSIVSPTSETNDKLVTPSECGTGDENGQSNEHKCCVPPSETYSRVGINPGSHSSMEIGSLEQRSKESENQSLTLEEDELDISTLSEDSQSQSKQMAAKSSFPSEDHALKRYDQCSLFFGNTEYFLFFRYYLVSPRAIIKLTCLDFVREAFQSSKTCSRSRQ